MGCDIHAHVEILRDGRWLHWDQPEIPRRYGLFERMAGVRGEVTNAVAPPRGLPADASETTKLHREIWGEDGHSDSWLSSGEMAALEAESWKANPAEWGEGFGYLFGNCTSGFLQDDQRQSDGVTSDEEARRLGVTDVRIVFWFDN